VLQLWPVTSGGTSQVCKPLLSNKKQHAFLPPPNTPGEVTSHLKCSSMFSFKAVEGLECSNRVTSM